MKFISHPWWPNNKGFCGTYALCAASTTPLVCPSAPGTHCSADSHKLNGVFYLASKTRLADITDGSSNTLAGTDQITVNNGWSDKRGSYWVSSYMADVLMSTALPPNTPTGDYLQNCTPVPKGPCDDGTNTGGDWVKFARSYHPGGVNAVLCDGSVRFVSDNVNPTTWRNVGGRNDGQVIGDY
jgi:prepilin-type processing-associated H-X9-DG protein